MGIFNIIVISLWGISSILFSIILILDTRDVNSEFNGYDFYEKLVIFFIYFAPIFNTILISYLFVSLIIDHIIKSKKEKEIKEERKQKIKKGIIKISKIDPYGEEDWSN